MAIHLPAWYCPMHFLWRWLRWAEARFSLMLLLLVGCAVILVAGTLIMGAWLTSAIEQRVIHHEGMIFALYVDSAISDHVSSLVGNGPLSDADRIALDKLFSGTVLGKHVATFKIWSRDGRVLYSTEPTLIGRQFEVKPELAAAFGGETISPMFALPDNEHESERQRRRELVETYAPVHERKTGSVVAVAEICQTTEILARAVGTARLQSWIVVSVATLIMYLLLAGLIKRANNIIVAQQRELREKVGQLTTLLTQNAQLHERVRRAGAHTTALNEQILRRVAADLHDGPAQSLALALMRMDTLAEVCSACSTSIGKERTVTDEFRSLHCALSSARDDLHAVAAGLPLPEIEQFSLAEIARRAVRDYERHAGFEVPLTVDGVPDEAPLPVRITLYRLLQESLANGFRHGGALNQRVDLTRREDQLVVEVTDSGNGFDPKAAVADGHLGLAGMRERVEILGGTFRVQSAPGHGTLVRAALPLRLLEEEK